MSNFTVITLTGDRPKTFKLCKFFMSVQTIKPLQWIIVDDGIEKEDEALEFPFSYYVRRSRSLVRPMKYTIIPQMLEALKHVKYDKIIMMEDDDWYSPTYLEQMIALFDFTISPSHQELRNNPFLNGLKRNPEIIGQGQAIYYNFSKQLYYQHQNKSHASLCATGFRKSFIPTIIRLCRRNGNDPFLDIRMWQQSTKKYLLLNECPITIGMKGLPGRAGIGTGHNATSGFYKDKNYQYLRKYIGNDVELYKELYRES